jgi:hypothetical protein
MNRITGEPNLHTTPAANQPTIESYPAQRMLDLHRNFETFKQLLIRWIVCCHIAFFQVENVYFRELLFFLYPGLEKFLPKAASTIRGWVTRPSRIVLSW